jgi:adenosine kinase
MEDQQQDVVNGADSPRMHAIEKKARRLTITKPLPRPGDLPVGFILGMGNPLLDMVTHVEKDFLVKYDLKLNNAVLADPKHAPMYEEIATHANVEYIAGGATQNSIRVCQWMLQSPGATSFIGSVGKECDYGEKLKKVANEDGVTTYYFEAPGHKTGTCAVVVHEKERSLVANLAAANAFDSAHLDTPEVKQAVRRAHIIYSAGFFLTLPEGPKSALDVAKHAAEHDKIYCLNFAAPFICAFFHEQLMSIIPYADFIFANESEAAEFAKKMGWETSDLTEVAAKVAALPKHNGSRGRVVVFTQGADPTIVFADGHVTLYPVVPVPRHLIVDTNGAGDAFVSFRKFLMSAV